MMIVQCFLPNNYYQLAIVLAGNDMMIEPYCLFGLNRHTLSFSYKHFFI